MADTTQQRGYYLPGNAFPSAAAPWDATALPVPQAPPSPLSPHVGPVPGHTGVQAGALQHAESVPLNAVGHRQFDVNGEDIPPLNEDIAAQGLAQDPWHNDMNHFDMAHYHPPPADLAAPREYHDVNFLAGLRVAQGTSLHAQPTASPPPGMNIFNHAVQHAPTGIAPAFLDGWPHQAPLPNELATEALRRLVSLCLNQPNSHVDTVWMEPSPAGGVKVVFTLELADLP